MFKKGSHVYNSHSFAWADGFRPAGSTRAKPGEAFAEMVEYWKEEAMHGAAAFPFEGEVIYWKGQ